ncbi:GWT1-domain-containing protein [Aspergillus candidus]|uniref:GPI-anchored wall transfer protein n=1 Tax=Aspergillus candidus TaxID=41067 RepID=A0A2I2F8Y0_ASPCN|nr:GWT1-domain-containing protein [Aspergillus candidus]PLB37079.1 GWT1-domain-containing protein [Aspergillus candidus]
MDMDYKSRKEAFVSGLSGGNIIEVGNVLLIPLTAILFWTTIHTRFSSFSRYRPVSVTVEFLLTVGIPLCALTVWYPYVPALNIGLVLCSALLLLCLKPFMGGGHAFTPPSNKRAGRRHQYLFISHHRGALMMLVCLAILAVDFQVFPRSLAKTENWGISVMDFFAGSFVFSSGFISHKSTRNRARRSFYLTIFGLLRLGALNLFNYQQHTSEYGVHWNLFFTIPALTAIVGIFDCMTAVIPLPDEALAIATMVASEICLRTTSLQENILSLERGTSLISLNQEGLFSTLGYAAIYLIGRAVGSHVFMLLSFQKRPNLVLSELATQAFLWVGCFVLASTDVAGFGWQIPVSRRLANVSYVFWVAAVNSTWLFLYYLIDWVHITTGQWSDKQHVRSDQQHAMKFARSDIISAFNEGGLAVFIIANIITGVVNLTVNTLDMSGSSAMTLLTGYAIFLITVTLHLQSSERKLRV